MKGLAKPLRRVMAVVGACLTLWTVTAVSGAEIGSAEAMRGIVLRQLSTQLSPPLSPAVMFTLSQSPYLAAAATISSAEDNEGGSMLNDAAPSLSPAPQVQLEALQFRDNGVPSQTVKITNPKGYTAVGNVYIKNSSSKTLDAAQLENCTLPSANTSEPQVLIIHTHGSEAYTLPKGESYVSTGNYRTSDTSCSVVRIGDEIAAVLSSYGISVLHDRTLYDDPLYSDAYSRSAAGAAAYLEKYPSLYYIIDIHRDAVEDAKGNQYKLVAEEDETIAQMSFVLGTNHDHWQENLALAVAVAENVQTDYPTAMRPIILRNSRYNQHLTAGSLLVEMGAAGNSLDEALHAGRIFAASLAEVMLGA